MRKCNQHIATIKNMQGEWCQTSSALHKVITCLENVYNKNVPDEIRHLTALESRVKYAQEKGAEMSLQRVHSVTVQYASEIKNLKTEIDTLSLEKTQFLESKTKLQLAHKQALTRH